MNIKFYKNFSFFNILIFLLIINLILDICFPLQIGGLYFFRVPLKNLIYHIKESSYLALLSEFNFYIPLLCSNFLTLYFIPFATIASFTENLLIKQKIILPKIKMEFSKKKKIILCVILFLAILAYLVSLGGWIHTMFPYSPEELENLRYD